MKPNDMAYFNVLHFTLERTSVTEPCVITFVFFFYFFLNPKLSTCHVSISSLYNWRYRGLQIYDVSLTKYRNRRYFVDEAPLNTAPSTPMTPKRKQQAVSQSFETQQL